MPKGPSTTRARAELTERLRERRAEIEEALRTRTYAIADPAETADPEYEQGLRAAVPAALDYGLAAIDHQGRSDPPIPVALLAQARTAARNSITLDTVLRRYFAGYSLLGYFIVEEALGLMDGAELRRLLGNQAILFDRLLAAIGEEHTREAELCATSSTRRQAEQIERLLSGELVDTADIPYDFYGWHLGVVAAGPDVEERIRDLARALDLRHLLLAREDGKTVWGWLGARRPPDPSAVKESAEAARPNGACFAVGEPGEGIPGWRLTHRQALTALPIARREARGTARYGEVALTAAALHDDLLAASLRLLYLEPLQAERDGGRLARETLAAYFAAERNVSSAAAALGVSRQAVRGRLGTIEERVGRTLESCGVELELALRLWEIGEAA